MRKIVSREEQGYTLFFENKKNDVNCVAFETGKHMTGQEVAEILKISRVAVSQNLKKSLKKIYKHLKVRNRNLTPCDIMLTMADMFCVKTELQYEKFFRLFDNNVKGEIYRDAKRIYRN